MAASLERPDSYGCGKFLQGETCVPNSSKNGNLRCSAFGPTPELFVEPFLSPTSMTVDSNVGEDGSAVGCPSIDVTSSRFQPLRWGRDHERAQRCTLTASNRSGEAYCTRRWQIIPGPPPNTNDFLWLMTEEPHRSRRTAIMKAHPEVCIMLVSSICVTAELDCRSQN